MAQQLTDRPEATTIQDEDLLLVRDVSDKQDGPGGTDKKIPFHILRNQTLRNEVEKASGGTMTVMHTAKGQASYFFVQSAFIAKDADTGLPDSLHPMFRANSDHIRAP